jgi:hypothetical protein
VLAQPQAEIVHTLHRFPRKRQPSGGRRKPDSTPSRTALRTGRSGAGKNTRAALPAFRGRQRKRIIASMTTYIRTRLRRGMLFLCAAVALPAFAAPPPNHPSPAQALEMLAPKRVPAEQLPNAGKVLTRIDANEYTYIEVGDERGKRWIAAPLMKVDVGDSIRYEEGATMTRFYSKVLQRTFDSLMFVGQVEIVSP